MKQFVAIYAVGKTTTDILNQKLSRTTSTPSLLKVLVDETKCEDTKEIPFSFLSGNCRPGLYVAVVNKGSAGELKVFPFTESNQTTINETIKPELLEKCSRSIDIFLGAADDDAEPTSAYVDQDPK